MTEELYNKIDKFCNETDWGKYPTYEQALEEFIKGIVAEETKELEKENAELKLKLEALEGQTPWKDIKDKSELIKENAELKGLVSQYKASKCSGISLANRNMIMSDQLTKAKEIIKELLDFDFLPDIEIKKQAEQFLSEVEK